MHLGKLLSSAIQDQRITLLFSSGTAYIEVLNNRIFHIFQGPENEISRSAAIEGIHSEKADISVKTEDHICTIETPFVTAKIYDDFVTDFFDRYGNPVCCDARRQREILPVAGPKHQALMLKEGHPLPATCRNHKIEVLKKLEPGDRFYGLGDKIGFMDRRGYAYMNWNTDDPDPHTELFEALYKSVPFFIVKKEKSVSGIFFDNQSRSVFDFGRESDDYYMFGADDGYLNYYFISGENMPEVVSGYTWLTGTTPLPQRWVLGYHQSRWGYCTEQEIRDVSLHYHELGIPFDCMHWDIDYMDSYKDFSWSEEACSDPVKLTDDLAEHNIKLVAIIDSGVKAEPGYNIYEDGLKNHYFCENSDGSVYQNTVWPGISAFPDFGKSAVRSWWAEQTKFLTDRGVRGIWNDMNEPASFTGPLPDDLPMTDDDRPSTHAMVHNVYGHYMDKATFEGLQKNDGRRPFVLTRACYAGTQKYSAVWTGDNTSLWSHLQFVIPQLTTLGLCGYAVAGTDICGFGGDTNAELMTRWYQVGAFATMMRNHSGVGARYQEPWRFGKQVVENVKKSISFHYRLVPYMYDLLFEGEKTGLAPQRPLVLHYENDRRAQTCFDEMLLGEQILAAPVVTQGAIERLVYLPEGKWIDYWTGEKLEGPCSFVRSAPLDVCPVYVKAGTVLPYWPEQLAIPDGPQEKLFLQVFPGSSVYCHYQDNGADYDYRNGAVNIYEIRHIDGHVRVTLRQHGYEPTYLEVTVCYEGREQTLPFAEQMDFIL